MAEKRKKQRDQLWLIGAEGTARREFIADVAMRLKTYRMYQYSIPAELIESIRPGALVRVPYGRAGQTRDGWCVRITERDWDQTYKPIEGVICADTLLTESLLELGAWVSEYYACPPGHTIDTLVPAMLRKTKSKTVRYLRRTDMAPEKALTAKQQALYDAIGAEDRPRTEALHAAGVSAAILQALLKQGLLEETARRETAKHEASGEFAASAGQACAEDDYELTPGQAAAVEKIEAAVRTEALFRVFLLFGVPGSGKTEVYVRAIRSATAAGKQAVLLVPEIALATQVVERLARRFDRTAVLHSRLKGSVRERTLRAIAAGEVDVVIGTRTAVFAPCKNLGLIAVDEEQESSFKNIGAPYFHARDAAIKRGHIEGFPVVLGSATPALETWSNAGHAAHYELLRLPERVPGALFPKAKIVPMDRFDPQRQRALLSRETARKLKETLETGKQAILLHNRRGFATNLRCPRCGMIVTCERCGAAMVYHRADDRMKCHRCGARRTTPRRCLDSTCGGELQRFGSGIQRLEAELQRVTPRARLQRLDSDTMLKREDYAAALTRFAEHEADILLGTQMAAKGLDFPEVSLVGVLEADAGLRLPDFRAAETTFQLIMQVVGRAGRREGESLALVQAEDTKATAIRAAIEMDYERFAKEELEVRKEMFDPPFSRLVRFICADASPSKAREESEGLAERLRSLAARFDARIRVEAAEDCVIPRLREMTRRQVILRTPREVDPRPLLRDFLRSREARPQVQRFTIDVDPVDMM